MNWKHFLQAILVQAISVALLSLLLAALLPHSFFEDWGWIAGPLAWALCALLVAAVTHLPAIGVLIGAALAGLPSLLAVALGEHWLGAVLAVPLFGLWCGWLSGKSSRSTRT